MSFVFSFILSKKVGGYMRVNDLIVWSYAFSFNIAKEIEALERRN